MPNISKKLIEFDVADLRLREMWDKHEKKTMQMLCPLIKLKEKQNKNTWEKKKVKNRKISLIAV